MMLVYQRKPIKLVEVARPVPGPEQILIRVRACGVCRTDLHIADGELPRPKLPLILGHEIVGIVDQIGDQVRGFRLGDRIGVPWLGRTDGTCRYCRTGRENLCDDPLFTGYTADGGYAEYAVADYRYCLPMPDGYSDTEIAPLLCAGLIGYRSYRMVNPDAERIGFYGFGAAAHLLAQLAVHEGKKLFAFTKPGDRKGQAFARRLGACWAGSSEEMPPERLDAAIIFAPVGALIPAALRATAKGGSVICGGIHMSPIPEFPYEILWEERSVLSVANLTREDGRAFFELAPKVPVKAEVVVFPLEQANEALDGVRRGTLEGAAVLKIGLTPEPQKALEPASRFA
jgi:alcohol dehydrogenase, propanol-preferring